MSKNAVTKVDPTVEAKKWMERGIEEALGARVALQSVKEKALLAGWFFGNARRKIPHGEWEEFLQAYNAVSSRTVRSYIAFAEDVIVTVLGQKKKFTDDQLKNYQPSHAEMEDPKLLEAGKHAVLHSSIGFVELCRELSLFRKFGEYDAVRNAAAKARAAKGGEPVQITFDFGVAMAGLRHMALLDQVSTEHLPKEKLPEIRDQLATALSKVEARMKEITLNAEAA